MQNQKQNGQTCVVCGNPGANWIVEWNGVKHPVHNQSAPEDKRCSCRLASWAPPDAPIRLFRSPELRSEKTAERVLTRMENARNNGRKTVNLRELREAVAQR